MEIVIYFSRRGENFIKGKIEELLIGNTEAAAYKIAEELNSKLLELKPVTAYPNSYQKTTKQAERERQQHTHVPYTIKGLDLENCETIFLGYPNWWSGLPQIVVSFIEDHDWQGKTIYPFCTHEGSGMGSSIEELRKLCPKATIKTGLSIRGSRVARSDTAIKNWLATIKR